MKPFLVHVHVYYQSLWQEISDCLKNIKDYDFKLFVTLVKNDPEFEKKITDEWPTANIVLVQNRGFDVGPFITILNNEDLNQYSYIIKLHTKRDIPSDKKNAWYAGPKWRNALLGFLKSKETFAKVLNSMENNPKIGMHGPNISTFNKLYDEQITYRAAKAFITEHGLKFCKFKFVAGSMFMVKADLFQKLKELKLTQDDFEAPDVSHEGCQLAHIFERLFGFVVYDQDYDIVDCEKNVMWSRISYILMNLRKIVMNTLITVRVTRKNKLLIKILKIPVIAIPLKK
ncbi:Rhamnan synthesis protein F [Succinivibrio dextrinosolvens]|uniref:rhamnan synthesis F family protein n=1 Tax=Succinivibrio dextrinosolvens TaxID=83771 RepID=UPI0008EC2400|nr:rhamnan synthesis F family protein [Succinivibrio dextrinosolvens]SFS85521.1 Rhamnan synthesis protein F [Succinivibrio dextrinosolvens]